MAYIGNSPTSATFAIDSFNGDGSTVNFTLRESPVSTSSILVFVGGVRQATDTYSLSGTTLTFTEAPPSGTNNIQVLFLGLGASPTVPTDGSVTAAKLADSSVTTAKLADGAVTGPKLGATSINANNIVDGTITSAKLSSNISVAGTSEIRGTSTQSAELRLFEDTDNGNQHITLKANNSISSNIIFTLPNADGSANQVLTTDGTGNLSFSTVSGGATKGQAIAFSMIFGL